VVEDEDAKGVRWWLAKYYDSFRPQGEKPYQHYRSNELAMLVGSFKSHSTWK